MIPKIQGRLHLVEELKWHPKETHYHPMAYKEGYTPIKSMVRYHHMPQHIPRHKWGYKNKYSDDKQYNILILFRSYPQTYHSLCYLIYQTQYHLSCKYVAILSLWLVYEIKLYLTDNSIGSMVYISTPPLHIPYGVHTKMSTSLLFSGM